MQGDFMEGGGGLLFEKKSHIATNSIYLWFNNGKAKNVRTNFIETRPRLSGF